MWRFVRAGLWVAEYPAPVAGAQDRHLVDAVVREAGPADVARLSAAMGVPPECVETRLAMGKRCFVADVESRCASYGWITLGHEEVPELERAVHPERGEAYVWDCYTLPEYRGYGLLPALLHRIALETRGLGVVRCWAVILSGNLPSQHAFAKAGYRQVQQLFYLRLANLGHLWLRDCPGIDEQIARHARRLFAP